ncbi:hypothetical protein FGG08_004633 [Glutinoglossum americanum]|uniref:Pentatricopeptide repeat-containing protein-mitochondrial domain-containing protein n=1 Tax=Glutinoglossum americanum TaxID=1670608 RepID=A0A9P8L2B2_9PEZI|nr:hypothetical protein FGG08_004633 [Glutinoglossum americanum]
MATTKVAIDGLWCCLRPALNPFASTRAFKLVLPRAGIHINSLREPHLENECRAKPFYSKSPHNPRSKKQLVGWLHDKELADASNEALHEKLLWDALEGNVNETRQIVDYLVRERHERPNLTHYGALIQSNISPRRGSAAAVEAILNEMEEEGIHPNADALSVHPDYILRNLILDEMHQRWYNLRSQGWHDIICGLIRERQYELALDKLEHLQRQGVGVRPWLYDQLTFALCEAEELDEALKIMKFRVMREDPWISGNSWYCLLDTASRCYHYDGTRYAWKKRVETNFINPSDGICINVLNTAARHGDSVLATDVFRVLGNRSVKFEMHHYEALLEAYTGGGDIRSAMTVLCIMKSAGVEPSEASTRAIYMFLHGQSDGPKEAFEILQLLRKDGRNIPVAAINCVLEVLASLGNITQALVYYKQLRDFCSDGPNRATYNVLLRGCGIMRRKDLALSLLSEMLALNISPNSLTYDRLILVCVQGDNYEDAFKYLKVMEDLAFTPRIGTYKALVTKCARAGDARAWELIAMLDTTGVDTAEMRQESNALWGAEGMKSTGGVEGEEPRGEEYKEKVVYDSV